MVKACDTGHGNDGATADRRGRARSRRVPVERHVRAVLVVVARVLSDQAEQVAFTEHDQVIQKLAS